MATSGDGGPATKAGFSQVTDMKFDAAGNLYIADLGNGRIRRVDTSGTVTTIAGTGQNGFGGDGGPATSAVFNGPIALAIDSTGAVIVADLNNNRVRRVVPGGAASTIAGQTLSIGDGGSSTLARMTKPLNIAVDAAYNLYIADSGENRIRKVAASGTITTFAGTGAAAESGDGGPASAAALRVPRRRRGFGRQRVHRRQRQRCDPQSECGHRRHLRDRWKRELLLCRHGHRG
jgi:hypothetical protein